MKRRAFWWKIAAPTGFTAIAWFVWFLCWAPLAQPLENPAPMTSLYLDAKGRTIAELPGPVARSHRPVGLGAMGPWISEFTVSMEDKRFYSHPGVDVIATVRAIVRKRGGGSTITQQLVKTATDRKGRSLLIKVREMLLALQLERRWSKQQILEAYLNRIPYGNRIIGIEAAAQSYFGKPAAALNKPEVVYLVGVPREPSRLNPWSKPQAAAKQFERSLRFLTARGLITSKELAAFEIPKVERIIPENIAPHFIQAVCQRIPQGTVRCLMDIDMQRRAEQIVRDQLEVLHRADISEGAMVVIENETGAVRAMVGSNDFKTSQINGALSYRNCGSTLKPFLYLSGIEHRVFTAATLLPDTPDAARDAYGDYDPHNFVMSHLGPVRVREALGNSLNVPAVVAVSRIGARKAFDAISDWGVKFDGPLEKSGAGFILGNAGVRLLDLTAAYASLARGGLAAPPRLLESQPFPLRCVASPEAVEIVTDILCDNSARLQSFGPRSALAFPMRVAGKTGTSAGFRDAWAMGFTKEHSVGVWVGNFDGRPMDHAASIASAAPLWRRMMDDLLVADHAVPESKLPRTPVCALTGLKPCSKSPAIISELFLPGTEPTGKSDNWFASDGHPILPAEYAAWCASADNHLGASIRPVREKLTILFPRNNAEFVLDHNVAMRQQQIEFQANETNAVTWKVNGEAIVPGLDGRILWQLAEGEWTVQATTPAAEVASKFIVRQR